MRRTLRDEGDTAPYSLPMSHPGTTAATAAPPRSRPHRITSEVIISAALATAFLALSLPTALDNALDFAVWLVLGIAGGLLYRRPALAGGVVAAVLTVAAIMGVIPRSLSVLVGPVSLVVLMSRGRGRAALLIAAWQGVGLFSATFQLSTPGTSVANAAVWIFLLVGCLIIGWVLRTAIKGIAAAQAQRVADLVEQRRAIARELHDTAVRATTEIVLHAETALGREGVDPRDAAEFARISRTARLATDELRSMMESLRESIDPDPQLLDLPVLASTWNDVVRSREDQLRALGFTVRANVETSSPVPPHYLGVLARCLDEIVANVVRHGDRAQAVTLLSESTEDALEVVVMNGVQTAGEPSLRGGAGLRGVRERLSAINGMLDARADAGTFITSIEIPFSQETT